ncbi:atrial natriuretic peptide receptor 1-like [Paramacrobiotus metropolitanus]|uniref:atrial natriuretic peptide receptor 1-like n=1 Tax=Paramacrobiotus metropolitanus TaxID=2943436 RepID=UPI0024463718|nr:atrial natriuretic peptide receptor 1-like [Paramacrobiotus metropolitanus]
MMHLLFYGLTLSLHLLPLFLCVKFDNPNQMHIHAITILIGDMTPFSYYAVGPTLDVAFKRLQHDYPTTFANMSRTIIHEPGALSCADGAALVPALSDKIYEAVQRYPNSFTVMFSPGCSLEIVALGDFAREWDIPLFASSSSDGALSDKQRYPTVMSFTSSDEVATFVSFQLFLGRYRWRTITLLCDAPSQFQALSTFYMVACRNIKRFLDGSTTTKFLTNKLEFDSVKTLDYATLLSRVQDQSRVQVICAHPRIVRDIMVTAKRLNMTNGDYIFFTFQTTRVPGMTEILWQFLDDNDEAAFDGFQSLISFQNPNPKWELISDILEEAKNNSLDRYNRSVSRNEQLNDLAISGYESVLAFAQVFLELRADINTLTGTSFARRFYNRSFNPCFRNFFINENGMRMNDAVYQRLNVDSGVLEDTWLYDFASSVLREVSPKLAHTWKSKDGPPPDVPQCGYRNDLCATSNTQTLIISGVLVAVAVIICIGLTTALYWKFSNKMSNKSPWWQLHYTDLQPLSNPGPAWIMVRQRLPEAELSVCTNRRLHHGQSVTIEPFYGKCLSVHQILEQATFRNVLYATRFLQHENVNRFVGIATSSSPAYSYMVFDYGARDTLRLLIQNEPIHMDHTLKSSMIWEIVHVLP